MKRYSPRAIASYLQTEAAGGVILLIATVVALIWANSAWGDGYASFWETHISITVDDHVIEHSLRDWINEGLMTIFFFVVGLEIKRELVDGELNEPRKALLPVIAAVGGMVVPALVFLVVAGGVASHGWAVPTATDIAFALGVLSLAGDRVPATLKVFLLSIAIADDVGAIVIIAAFYSTGVNLGLLALAVALLGAMGLMNSLNIKNIGPYLFVGVLVWFATLESGIHATIAGAIMGMLAPARASDPEGLGPDLMPDRASAAAVRTLKRRARDTVSVVERLEYALHPWASYVIVPLFALANAGVVLGGGSLGDALSSRVTLGVVLGLVVGKTVGIALAARVAVRLGVSDLPAGVTWRHVIGMAMVAGVGFTVSLFIVALAFAEGELAEQAKIGILAGSALAAVGGVLLLRGRARSPSP